MKKSANNDVSEVDVDLRKEKQKAYNREYYAQNKERIKMRRMANGEGSSRCTPLIRNITAMETTQLNVEPSERVPLENVTNMNKSANNDVSGVDVDLRKEKQKTYNREYYAQNKERIKIRRMANGEGSSRCTPLIGNITAMETTQLNVEPSERVPLEDITNMCGTVARKTHDITTSHHQVLNEMGTEGTPVSAITIAQQRMIYNTNYYQQFKETNSRTTSVKAQGSTQLVRSTIETTEMQDVVGQEGTPQICSGLTNENFNDVGPSTQINIVSSIIDDILHEDQYDFVYDGIPTEHRVLEEQDACIYCGAKRFSFEFRSFCCMSGKTRLAYSPIPEDLYQLFTSQSELGKIFRHNIRAYNTNFSFTSMGVTLDSSTTNMTSGVYTFRAHGGIYHKIDQLVPRDGQPRNIVEILTRVLATNPYAITFRSLAELGPLDNYRVTLNASVELDQRVYNRPTTSEVAGIWVEGNDNITTYKRSIIVYGRSDYSQTIQHYFACYDPLAYPLFFPNGEAGWHSKIPRHGVSITEILNDEESIEEEFEEANERRGKNNVSMREYYCYKFQIRSNQNVLLLGGRLFQQFVVDVYIKIETARLDYFEKNQKKIRSDLYQGVVDCVNAGESQPCRIGQRIVLPASFIGGPRDMRRRFLDAMTLVQDDGKPDMFLTVTCNPKWPEILTELLPGQTAQDRPDLVARVFRAKLEDLKEKLFNRHILGFIEAYVYVVEFQKRGLPHAHFLLIMAPQHKMTNPDHYDRIICAEIPDPAKHHELHRLVVTHMMHGPCGHLRPSSPCMEGAPRKCRFKYPRQFIDTTTHANDSYPLYRRRNNGMQVNVRGNNLDNRWVVPYNPKLLMMFNCHINVEACSSIKSVKYIFKYVYKGHDKQVVSIDQDGDGGVINEIKRFKDARYVSPPEAIWRIFSFRLSQIYPPVMALQVHLPNRQFVRFSDDDIMTDVVERERDKRTMLTAFFHRNRVDMGARNYLYKDFPKYYTWNASSRQWNLRKQRSMRGRLVSTNPAEGERFYLRLLLSHIRGPTSFEDLCTVNGLLHPTFRKAALQRGLIETDDSLSQCLAEASLFQFPNALRRLFATILIYCEPGDVRKLWNDHYDSLCEDYMQQYDNVQRVQDMVLTDIMVFLQSLGKDLKDFDLPRVNTNVNLEDGGFREVQEEYSIIVEDEHLQARDSLNSDQKSAFDEIMRHVEGDCSGMFFIDGPGGTGKTFLYKALLAEVRSRGLIALATASSGVAANNMPGGRTAHSRFKIPLNLDNNSVCNIKQQSGTAQLLRDARLIIWDEASMAKRQAVEALDRTMQDLMGNRLPFGGKIMVMGGDFRQVLPVVRRGTRAQIVDCSLRMSPLWSSIKKIRLTINMRALTDPWFSEFLLRVGDGNEETVDETFIRIPDDMTIPYNDKGNSKDALIEAIFPSLEINGAASDYIISRAILSTKNENVDEINDELIERFCGEEKIYYSFDEAQDDRNNFYPTEFLNSLTVSGLPPHYLRLKIGCPIILLRNIDPTNGLCNGTRLICRGFQQNVIDAEIAVGQHVGKRVFLPRIPLCPSEDGIFPFKLKRKQFPVRLSFSMTINKAQGQTIPNVGVYLPEPVFSHGQLYVALSRGISRRTTKVLVKPAKKTNRHGVYTSNVVYQEVLRD